MKATMFLLSTLPAGLICADNVWLCLLGLAYAGVWMWIVNEKLDAYDESKQNNADKEIDR